MSFWKRQKYARRLKKMFVYFGRVQKILVYFGLVENTGKLDKTLQLQRQLKCDIHVYVMELIEMENRRRDRHFHAFYSDALLPLNIYHFGSVQNKRTYFRCVENK